MIDRVQMNARKPENDEYGEQMLERMNTRHQELSLWGLSHIGFENTARILDIGCGGGRNIANMLSLAPKAFVCGIDYSEKSVEMSRQFNISAVNGGKAEIIRGTAEKLPYDDSSFDTVTAFETVYYWSGIEECFAGVRRVLKNGGSFLVCNEDCDRKGIEEASQALGMTLYTAEDIADIMKKAGFSSVSSYSHENGRWVCAIGKK